MSKKAQFWTVVILAVLVVIIFIASSGDSSVIRVGYISDLSGSSKKYGAYEAGKLAMDEINKAGGIDGKRLQIIFEDGKCTSKDALSAANKLIQVDKVKVILGGHCTPESVAIAPVADKNKIVMLAGITSTPLLSSAGEYVFRTTSVSTVQSTILAEIAVNKLGGKKFAVIYEQSDFARPIAEQFKSDIEAKGGAVNVYEGFGPDVNDFHTIVAKVLNAHVDGVMISPQRPDAGFNIIKQLKEYGVSAQLFGNDTVANAVLTKQSPWLFEGLIFAGPNYDIVNNPLSKKFNGAFIDAFGYVPPYGIFTAESYDAVYIIADAIEKYGTNPDKIKKYLSNLKDYEGASGRITINEKHDGVREYVPKIIKAGGISLYQ